MCTTNKMLGDILIMVYLNCKCVAFICMNSFCDFTFKMAAGSWETATKQNLPKSEWPFSFKMAVLNFNLPRLAMLPA